MKPNVGMSYAVAAPVDTYTPYNAISYDDGFVVCQARGATVTWETEDGEFYGDNVLLDSANNVLGYTIDFETTGLSDTVRAGLLGEVKGSSDEYKVTGAGAPDVGFGYIKEMRDDASGSVVTSWEAWWFYKVKFAQPNEEARTKERNMEWRVPSVSGKGAGVLLSSGAEAPDFAEHKTFSTLASAKTYLNGKAGIS